MCGAGGGGEASDQGSDENNGPPPALERALRRGLSDSSIHTTFTQHGDEPHPDDRADTAQPADRESVLQALSRKMHAFRFISGAPPAVVEASTSTAPGETSTTSRPQTPVARKNTRASEQANTPKSSPPRPIPKGRGQGEQPSTSLFDISSWTAGYPDMQDNDAAVPASYYASSPRDEVFMQRNWRRERDI